MDLDIIKELYSDYSNAIGRLTEAVNEDESKGDIVFDGTIQRFEFTFELAWKLMKAILVYSGIEALSPRAAIKEAFRMNFVSNGDGWIEMLEDRNRTSHIYDKGSAMAIYNKIKEKHFELLKNFLAEAKKYI